LAALAALIHVSRLDPGYTGPRYTAAGPDDESSVAKQPPVASVAPTSAATRDAGVPVEPEASSKSAGAKARAKTDAPRATAAPDPHAVASAAPGTLPSAAAPVQVAVTMYATPWCFICDRARDFLLARNVSLTERNIERDPASVRRLRKLNPALSVPTFEIEGQPHVGFNAWDLEDAIRNAAEKRYASRLP
jgi:glutaredoxin